MSLPLTSVKEKLKMVSSRLEKIDVELAKKNAVRLKKINTIIEENESKIWLRTKVGQPMVSSLNASVDTLLKTLEETNTGLDKMDTALIDVEDQIRKLDEESQRRGMVVT